MPERILHIVPSLSHSGIAHQLLLLAKGLPQNEFEFHVAAINAGGPVSADLQSFGIEPVVVGRRWAADPRTFWQLRRHMLRLQPTVIHTWLFEANTYGRIAALTAGIRRLVAAERNVDTWKSNYQLTADRRLARRTLRIVANSVAVRDFYASRGMPADQIEVIPGAVDDFTPSPISRAELLTELGLPRDAKLLAYLGPLTKQKRLKELIWAADQLKAVGTTAHLLMVGDGPLRSALQRYARLNRVEDRIHFLGARNDVPRLLSHVDIVWHAGNYEGQSSAILEAMAAGIPVIAADAAGNRELVTDGVTGHLVPLHERAGFARWTLPLLENSELARRLGAAGRQHVLQFHQPANMVAHYARLYREL